MIGDLEFFTVDIATYRISKDRLIAWLHWAGGLLDLISNAGVGHEHGGQLEQVYLNGFVTIVMLLGQPPSPHSRFDWNQIWQILTYNTLLCEVPLWAA